MRDHLGDLIRVRETVRRGARPREGMRAKAITEALARATETGAGGRLSGPPAATAAG